MLYTDNFYTSIPLAELLFCKSTYLIGTLRKNIKGIPKEVINTKIRRGKDIIMQNKSNIMIRKYKDKRDI